MKVLIYALNYHPERIGVGRYTGDVGLHLERSGLAVRVVTAVPHYPQWAVAEPFKAWRYHRETRPRRGVVIRCPLLLRRPMRGIWRLLVPASFAVTSLPVIAWEILRGRPQVVLCVEPTLLAAPVAVLLAKLVGARMVLYVQDLEIDAAFAVKHLKGEALKRAALAVERLVVRQFDRVITISLRMRDGLLRKGIDGSRIAVVRNWVDLDTIRPLSGRNGFRIEHGWPDDLLIALYAGSIGAKQALHVALDAAELLVHRRDILFAVVGDGPAKPRLVARYGHLGNVVFLPPQPESRLCELLNLADVHLMPQSRGVADLVLPSKLGGMLASGKPVLVTADAGTELHDLLRSSAVVVPAGDSAAIARELEVFADGCGRHPAAGDTRPLARSMARTTCLRDLTAELLGSLA